MTQEAIAIRLIVNFLAVAALFWKVSRFMAHIEFKVDLMWSDYVSRHEIAPKDRRAILREH